MNIWENSIKMDLGEVVCEEMDWFNLTQGRVQWRAILNTIMNI
jgi:translation initiation factor IF-1